MLSVLREGVKSGLAKFILLGIMTMAVGGLVMTDVGGFFRGGGTGANNVVSIGGSKMPAQQFDQTVRRVLTQQNLDTETAFRLGFIDQILFREINGTLMAKNAQDLGLLVSDKIVAGQIKDIVEPHITEEMPAEQVLKYILRSQNMTERQMVSSIKNEMTSTMISNALASNARVVSDEEARALYQYRNEKRDVELIIFPNNKVKDFAQPTDEELLAYYDTTKQNYMVPETRRFSYVTLTEEKLANKIEIAEEEMKAIYEQDIDIYTVPEKRKLEQAIFTDEAKASAAIKALEANGKNLKKAIETESDSAGQYVGTEEFEEKALIKNLAAPVFTAAKGDVIGPVQTPLGYHVVILKDIIAGKQQDFATVKEDIREFILYERLGEELYELSGEMDDAFAGGETMENVAKSFELTISTAGPMRADGSTADSKDAMKDFKQNDIGNILETVFDTAEGEISPVIELSEGKFIALRVDEIQPLGYKPFEEVKAELKKQWIEKEKALSNAQKVSGYLTALENGETSLAAVAKENGLKSQNKSYERFGVVPEELTSSAKDKIFNAEQGHFVLSNLENGFLLAHVKEIKLPDTDKMSEEDLADVTDRLTKAYNTEYIQLYLNHLFVDNKVRVNRPLIKSMYGPKDDDQ